MKITRFNHAALNIAGSGKETQAFYTELLGIPTTPRPPEIDRMIGGCWLQFPNAQIHLIDAPLDGRPRNPVGNHVSLFVDDIAAAEREVAQRGLATVQMGDGRRKVIWFSDPAGHTVELQQDPEL
jgi:catechol 2,3-dioxygenase-like lactoylglutathione lyase family enzyme